MGDTLDATRTHFNIDEIMAKAKEDTGLSDFGDPWFMEPFEVLVGALNRGGDLSSMGLQVQKASFLKWLTERLRRIELVKRNPEIAEEKVEILAEIVGLPRTGSTMVHRLLTSSPQVTSTYSWELLNPLPFPGETPGDPQMRKDIAEAMAAFYLQAMPDMAAIHPLDPLGYEEDVLLLDRTFMSTGFQSTLTVPSYDQWLLDADQRPAYRELREWLQILQWQDKSRAGKKWLLKSPHHLTALRAILDVFPECSIVVTHRTPVETVPSYASMVYTLTKSNTDKADPREIGAYWDKRFQRVLRDVMEVRKTAPERFIDIRYKDVQNQPIVEARKVFDALGLPYGAEEEALMESWLVENAREKHPPHKYSAEDFGLTRDALARDFKFYIDAYLA